MTDLTELTGAELLSSLYPSRWYGLYSDDRSVLTAIVDTHHPATHIGDLPKVSDMAPLTQDQFLQALNAPFKIKVNPDGTLVYPHRYAAAFIPVVGPARVAAWIDYWDLRATHDYDEQYQYLPLSVTQWNDPTLHTSHGVAVSDDTLIRVGSPLTDLTPSQIAKTLIPMVESDIVRSYSIRGQDIPADVVSYLKALDEVAKDPNATKLPIPPAIPEQ